VTLIESCSVVTLPVLYQGWVAEFCLTPPQLECRFCVAACVGGWGCARLCACTLCVMHGHAVPAGASVHCTGVYVGLAYAGAGLFTQVYT
jgi:hypothetical protein